MKNLVFIFSDIHFYWNRILWDFEIFINKVNKSYFLFYQVDC